jgi:hypothetical protein
MKTIKIDYYNITVELDEPDDAGDVYGKVTSDLHKDISDDYIGYHSAIEGLETMILAQAIAGIDVTTPSYLRSVENAVELICYNTV